MQLSNTHPKPKVSTYGHSNEKTTTTVHSKKVGMAYDLERREYFALEMALLPLTHGFKIYLEQQLNRKALSIDNFFFVANVNKFTS